METILLVVVLAALVFIGIAFFRAGGDFRPEYDRLTRGTASTRNRIADALDRLEAKIRGRRETFAPDEESDEPEDLDDPPGLETRAAGMDSFQRVPRDQ